MLDHYKAPSRSRLLRLIPALALLAGVLFSTATPAYAQPTGISYTLAPTGQYVFWSDDAGFENGYFYGGALGFGFGEYLELSGLYLLGDNFETDVSDLDITGEADNSAVRAVLEGLPSNEVDLRRYGGKIRLNVGSNALLPFITLGSGILRFEPENEDIAESEVIYASAGAGITLSLADRYTLSVAAENLVYRYNPLSLFSPSAIGELEALDEFIGFDQTTVYNPSVTAALRLYLGGRSAGELTELDRALREQFGGGGVRVFAQPFYGQINFNEALTGLPDKQPLGGVNAGIDLGPYVGLRGFYWRATDEEDLFEDTVPPTFADLAFYGGELNLRFGQPFGGGLAPQLIVGGGYMNILSGYSRVVDGSEVTFDPDDDRYFATGGVGLEFPLSSAFRLIGAARYLFMSTQDIEDLNNPDNVYGSPTYTAGIEFSFGGGPGRTAGDVFGRELRDVRQSSQQRDRQIRNQFDRLEAQIDSLERIAQQDDGQQFQRLQQRIDSLSNLTQTQQDDFTRQERREIEQLRQEVRQLRGEQGRGQQQGGQGGQGARQMSGDASTSNLSGQTVTVPVPNQGEIYVRFGETVNQTSVETVYGPPVMLGGGTAQAPSTQQQGTPGAGIATGGLTANEIRQLIQQELQRQGGAQGALSQQDIERVVRQTLSDQLQGMGSSDVQAAQINSLRDQLNDLESRVQRRLDRLSAEQRQIPSQPNVTVIDRGGEGDGQGGTRVVSPSQQSFYQRNLQAVSPVVGLRFGNETEFLVGARGDYSTGLSWLRFAPELELGFGGGTSINLFGNGIVPVGGNNLGFGTQPYVGAGLGLVSESGLSGLAFGVNLLAGAQYTFDTGAVIFGEFSTLSFFDTNRLLVGYRIRL